MGSDTTSAPQIYNHSLDWRFLLPITNFQQGRFLFEEDADFTQALEQVGILPAQQFSFSALSDLKNEHIPFLALPFGLHVSWSRGRIEDCIKVYSFLRRIMDADGYFLIGFNNVIPWRIGSYGSYHPSTPRRITSELTQAGFKRVKIFGAMPDLKIPEYIFDLDLRTIQFALQNRFRRKPVLLQALRLLSGTFGMQRMSNFLPGYFAVASG